MHKAIDEAATDTVENLVNVDVTYPPGIQLTPEEISALEKIDLNHDAKSGLQKLVVDACSYPLFHLFSLMDGVTEPDIEKLEDWFCLDFSDKNSDMSLHNDFYVTYWNYNKKIAKSGSQEFLSLSPHTTPHADPQGAAH
jgi:hypothetical protein